MRKAILLISLSVTCSLCRATGQDYPKAILRGDYPDPTVLRDGKDFYMTHSSFSYGRGFLIWHSTDLHNWTPICRVKGTGMAPDLVKHDGKYYIYYPWGRTNYVVWAHDIKGPWSAPTDLHVSGIDPGHVTDSAGNRYLHLSEGTCVRLASDGLSVEGQPQTVYEGWQYPTDWKTECFCLESPKLTYKDGWYYLTSAEGGTAGPSTSHMAVSARSRRVTGPWVNSPYNPIVHTNSADDEWWSKGHGTIIDDNEGNWWIIYHAYPKGCHTLGRSTLIEPITWTDDGWFRTGGGHNVAVVNDGRGFDLSDDFSGTALGLQWNTWGRMGPGAATIDDGRLILKAKGQTPADGTVLLATPTDKRYETQVEMEIGEGNKAGLLLYYRPTAWTGITADDRTISIHTAADKKKDIPNSFGKRFLLKIVNDSNNCRMMACGDSGKWVVLARHIDTGSLNHNVYNGFRSLRIALFSAKGGTAHFRKFVYKPLQ